MVVVVVGVSKCIKNYYILLLLPKTDCQESDLPHTKQRN